MAVFSNIPEPLAKLNTVTPEAAAKWATDNAEFLKNALAKHEAWINESQIEKYQAAYDGYLDEIEKREKAKGDDTNYKLVSNYAQIIIDTVVDYMIAKPPVWTVEDPNQDDKETKEAPILTEYRKAITQLLQQEQAQRVLAEQLRQGSIACYSGVIAWVDEEGKIDFEEYPAQEIIPVMDVRGRVKMVLRAYDVDVEVNGAEVSTIKKLEVYDSRYILYLKSDETGTSFDVDPDEIATGNPIQHMAGRIPVSLFINGTAASYKTRLRRAGTSDLGNGVFDLIVAYSNGLSDKANLADYLQDQYLKLKGVDVDEKEVVKMRKARAIALKSKDADAEFIAQDQNDQAVENYLNRLEDTIYDTTFTPKISKLDGATATEIKMKYAALDIKAGKKEIYFRGAVMQLVEILTDLLNAKILVDGGNDSPYEILSDPEAVESNEKLYKSSWITFTLNRNLPQNNKEIADIVTELSGKVPDSYLYELLWFVDDPVKALEEMKAQSEAAAKSTAAASMAAMGYNSEFQSTGTENQNTNNDNTDQTTE